jgi:RNA polymerase sigma factor (sigma-70 family)
VNDKSDAQLLRDYAERGSEAAFGEIVTRHTDFVYSAALRQVDSSDLAADITQKVFVDLVRKAKPVADRLAAEASLAGWLHRATRYAALNHLRDRRRRLANERQAMNQLLANAESSADWDRIRPVLDEALDSLGDEDREALLLRYFKNQDFRTVGLALGVSDDAAQKRVSRAVERLREFFSKQKITIGTGGLIALISANAVQSAPIGLAATVSAAAFTGTALSTSTAIATTKVIAMTALQKTIIGTALAAAIGTGVFEAHQVSKLREQNQTLQQQQAPLAGQIRQLRQERDDATNRLAALEAENAQLQANQKETELLKLRGEVTRLQAANTQRESDPTETAAKTLAEQVNQLKQFAGQHPEKSIPELQLLTDKDWFATVNGRKLESDADYREALNGLRCAAKSKFGDLLRKALQNYSAANDGFLPGDLLQLKAYFESPVDDAMLERYKLLQTGKLNDAPPEETLVAEKAPPVDDEVDTVYEFRMNGTKSTGVRKP